MGIKRKGVRVWWMASVLSVTSFAATNDSRLSEAAKQGDNEAVRSLLKQHVPVNVPQADGTTALAWAVYRDDQETAELLIRAGANVNAANDYGAAPLLLACANGNAVMVNKLLKDGADPNATAWAGETALMECARTGSLEAVNSLLVRGANVNARETQEGHTALMFAVAQKHSEIAGKLIDHKADVNARSTGGFTPLMFAAQQGDLDSARRLMAAGANANAATPDGDTALLVASLSGHEALSIFLLDNGADPSAAERNGITALHYAVMAGLCQLVGIDNTTNYPITFLHRRNMVELVKTLLAHGANPNARLVSHSVQNDYGPGYGKIFTIDVTPPGAVSPVGGTPFLLAALTLDAELMRILAAGGADPRLATEENVTPLMMAAGLTRRRNSLAVTEEEDRRALEAVKVAVELGAEVNAANNLGLTALHGAAFTGANTVVQYLAKNGANLDAKDMAGQTPLHKALNIQPAGVLERKLFPYMLRVTTADLLLKLGATPVNGTVAQSKVEGGSSK